jgi:hypothetical protein
LVKLLHFRFQLTSHPRPLPPLRERGGRGGAQRRGEG